MSKNARLAAIGAVVGTAWAVFAALSIDALATRWALAGLSVAVPLAMWIGASRLRASGSQAAADRVVTWSLPAAMLMVFIVDFVVWSAER